MRCLRTHGSTTLTGAWTLLVPHQSLAQAPARRDVPGMLGTATRTVRAGLLPETRLSS